MSAPRKPHPVAGGLSGLAARLGVPTPTAPPSAPKARTAHEELLARLADAPVWRVGRDGPATEAQIAATEAEVAALAALEAARHGARQRAEADPRVLGAKAATDAAREACHAGAPGADAAYEAAWAARDNLTAEVARADPALVAAQAAVDAAYRAVVAAGGRAETPVQRAEADCREVASQSRQFAADRRDD